MHKRPSAYELFPIVFVLAGMPYVCGAEAQYRIVETHAAPGQQGVGLSIEAAFPEQAQGFSMALRHYCDACVLEGADVVETAAETAEFVEALADPDSPGSIVVGLLMRTTPSAGVMLPVFEAPEPVVKLVFDIAPGARYGAYAFSFVPEGLPSGSAWIYNVYAAFDTSHPVTSLSGATLTIGRVPQGGVPAFVRGDANQDRTIDLADPIYVLNVLFNGAGPAHCLDACDANDSGHVNIGDAVFLLAYLFQHGNSPREPFVMAGPDWTPDEVDCEDPIEGWTTDV